MLSYCVVLSQVWESKVVQSKALEDFRTNGTHSKFVLQLPANYSHPDRRPRGSPAGGGGGGVKRALALRHVACI